jgi:cyclase
MTAATPQFRTLAPGVHAWLGVGGDSNAGCIETPDGVIVIDAQQHRGLAGQLRGEMEMKLKKPLRLLVNTHYHLDHVAGNVVFDDIPILAHAATLERLEDSLGPRQDMPWTIKDATTKIAMFFGANIQELVPQDDPAWAWFMQRVAGPDYAVIQVKPPTETFTDQFSFYLGDETIRLPYWGPAHCVGDIPIIIERAKVAFLGDLLFCGRFPWLGDCDLDGWIAALDHVLTLDLAVVVPGHGPPATLAEVKSFRNLLAAIRGAVEKVIKSGASEEAASREVELPEYATMSRYREWMRFNVRSAYRYLKGRKAATRGAA